MTSILKGFINTLWITILEIIDTIKRYINSAFDWSEKSANNSIICQWDFWQTNSTSFCYILYKIRAMNIHSDIDPNNSNALLQYCVIL